jgi:NAD dependent epimerase/dehydratase family enzyme
MGRPHWVTLPSFVLKAALGEMSNLLITGQKAVPQKLLKEGFSFTYPTVNAALENLVQQLSVKK